MEAILSSRLVLAATAIALLLMGLLWLRVLLRPRRLGRKKKRYAPLVCSFLNQIINSRRIHDYLTDKARRFKCFRILHPARSYVHLADPSDVEYILRTNFANYGKGSYNNNILEDLLGDGIFAVDGGQWRHQRKLASFEFSTMNLRDYSSNTFKHNAARLAQVISSGELRPAGGHPSLVYEIYDGFHIQNWVWHGPRHPPWNKRGRGLIIQSFRRFQRADDLVIHERLVKDQEGPEH